MDTCFHVPHASENRRHVEANFPGEHFLSFTYTMGVLPETNTVAEVKAERSAIPLMTHSGDRVTKCRVGVAGSGGGGVRG